MYAFIYQYFHKYCTYWWYVYTLNVIYIYFIDYKWRTYLEVIHFVETGAQMQNERNAQNISVQSTGLLEWCETDEYSF